MTIELTEAEIKRALVKAIHREVLGTCGNMMGHDVVVFLETDTNTLVITAKCEVTPRKESKSADLVKGI